MLSQVKIKRLYKKGISEIIGYILLMGFVIILSVVVYIWMKNYIPKDSLGCPDEVSLFVKDYSCSTSQLTLVLKNNGKFNIHGYLIHARNYSEPGISTIDISKMITSGGTSLESGGVKMSGSENPFFPDSEETHIFDVSSVDPRIYAIEIVPIRWQEQVKRKKLVTCTGSKLEEILNC